MGLLDGLGDGPSLEFRKEFAIAQFARLMNSENLSPKIKSILQAMDEGLSLGDVLGIKKQHRDALIAQGGALMQAGDFSQAQDLLGMVAMMEPLDERAPYLLGIISQQTGDLGGAVRLYVHFLALDATNADGYLRLGECLLTAGEMDEAEGAFTTGLKFARQAGQADRAAHAELMLETVKSRRAGRA